MSMASRPRPAIELKWRAAMAEASVEEWNGYWYKTDAYTRLDPSEKTAVSYFLGMAQAKITTELLLNVSHLIHLDAVLAALGQSTSVSRPDFIGFDFSSMSYTMAVEAKGRSGIRDYGAIRKAKTQAGLMPTIVKTTTNICVASMASFNNEDRWDAYLEDPEWPYDELDELDVETLLVAYYRPLVAAMRGADQRDEGNDELAVVYFSDVDLHFGLPRQIVDALIDLPAAGPIDSHRMQRQGAAIRVALLDMPGRSHLDEVAYSVLPPSPIIAGDGENPATCTGLDGVRVILGRSWFPDGQVR
jgi:hypothetical protein